LKAIASCIQAELLYLYVLSELENVGKKQNIFVNASD